MEEVRIDIKALFKTIWTERITIIAITVIFVIIGGLYSFYVREEFETHGKILPELQGKGTSNLSQFAGIASLAGIDLNSLGGGSVDAVRPDLYPNVITSTLFYLELFKIKVHTRENKEMTFERYYHISIEKGKEPNEKLLKKYPVKEEGIILVNRLNEIRLKELRERITANIDKKSGVISIYSKMPDPVVAAEVTNFAMKYLMNYVKNYRTEKLRQDVDYLEVQVSNSRGKFYSTQEKKARYTDQFQDMRLQAADVHRERIESEYRLSSSFYNELLKKYEEAKFKLHQETPVFQVLEPPVVPVKKTEPRRIIIIVTSFFLGAGVAIIYTLLKRDNFNNIFGGGFHIWRSF